MRVHIYYVRHGFSCSNAAGSYRDFYHNIKHIRRLFRYDPPLTRVAIKKTFESQPHMPSYVDILCSSVLVRAIQTAVYSFPEGKTALPVIVVPYVSEIPEDVLTNKPISITKQRRLVGSKSKRVNYEFVKTSKASNGIAEWAARPDYGKFLQWMGDHLEELIRISSKKRNLSSPLKIAVATHSRYMMEYLLGGGIPRNNAVIEVVYDYDRKNKLLKQVPCPKVKNPSVRSRVSKPTGCGGVWFEGNVIPSISEFKKEGEWDGCDISN